jgi:hypothetical protein
MQEKPAEDFYSVEKAAKLLGRTPERIPARCSTPES